MSLLLTYDEMKNPIKISKVNIALALLITLCSHLCCHLCSHFADHFADHSLLISTKSIFQNFTHC